MKKIFTLVLIALGVHILWAQEAKQPLFGKVVDSLGSEVPYASLQLVTNNKTLLADERGRFDFGIVSFPDTLLIISDYYQPEKRSISKPMGLGDSLLVRLKFFFKQLNPVEVTAKYNLDSILQKAFEKFQENYAENYETDVFVRTVQQHDKIYTGLFEALGSCYFFQTNRYLNDYYIFENARSTGFEEALPFARFEINQTANRLLFALPWQAEWFNKSNVKISNQADLLAVTLTPKPEFRKELEKFDKEKILDEVPFFWHVVRTYAIDLRNNNLLSIDIKSSAAARSRYYDGYKRNFVMRNYYYKFTHSGKVIYLDYTKKDYYITAPKRKAGIWRFTETLYFSRPRQKKLDDHELGEKYKVSIDEERSKRERRTVRTQGQSINRPDYRFYTHTLPYKNFNGTFNRDLWEKNYIPPILDRKKLFEDLKDNPHIGDFISKNEK